MQTCWPTGVGVGLAALIVWLKYKIYYEGKIEEQIIAKKAELKAIDKTFLSIANSSIYIFNNSTFVAQVIVG